MLTMQEKDDLMTVINILFKDNQLQALKHDFNDRTVEVVEKAMEELVKCNARMRELVTGLTLGISIFTRGWLRRSLDKVAQALRDRRLKFDGMACRHQVAAIYQREIYLSTF